MRKTIFSALMALATLALTAVPALADRLVARVSLSQQVMHVYHHGQLLYEWPVSTARAGKITPTGAWRPQFLSRNHRSSLYNNAPMPYSVFYSGNFAIHGTDQINRLGRPASAGCVRLHPSNARTFFEMVQAEGMAQTRVVVVR